jgi:hypothetical protein
VIYLPLGTNWPGKTVEPNDLLNEFYTVLRTAQRTSQFQWKQAGFADLSNVLAGENIILAQKSVTGHFFTVADTLPNFGAANLWTLPYNASPTDVGDGDVAHDWVSSYPELVVGIFTFQYCRDNAYITASPNTFFVRSRIQLAFDGARLQGAGCYTIPIDPTPRGVGLAVRTLRTTIVGLTFLPAGAHRFGPVASQYSASVTGSDGDAFRAAAEVVYDTLPTNVKIGTRKTILLRAPQGRRLAA